MKKRLIFAAAATAALFCASAPRPAQACFGYCERVGFKSYCRTSTTVTYASCKQINSITCVAALYPAEACQFEPSKPELAKEAWLAPSEGPTEEAACRVAL